MENSNNNNSKNENNIPNYLNEDTKANYTLNKDNNCEDYDEDDDVDIDKLTEEMKKNGIDIEITEGEDPYYELDKQEIENEHLVNISEEESFKTDEDYLKMKERKENILINSFPNFEAEGEIYSVAINEKNDIAIVGDGEEYQYTFKLSDFSLISKEKVHLDSIVFIRYSFNKSYLLIASMDGIIKLYKGESMKLEHTIEDNSDEIMWIDWHPKGNVFAFGTSSGNVFVYNAKDGQMIMSLYGHGDCCSCGMFSIDGKILITGSHDKSAKIWELKNQSCKYTVKGYKYHNADILCMAIGANKNIMASGSGYNEIGIVNYDSGNIVHFYKSENDNYSIETICFTNDDKFIVFTSTDHLIRVLELQKLTTRVKIELKGENISKIIPSKMYKYIIYMGTSFGKFMIFDSRGNGTFLIQELLHCSGIMDFALTDNEQYVFTSSIDRSVNLMKIDPNLLDIKDSVFVN